MPPFNTLTIPDMLMSVVKTGSPWLKEYGLWLVAFGMFMETFVFTGLIVPGVTILIASGFFIANGTFAAAPTLAVAWVATVLGDQASYWLGYRWGTVLLRKKHAQAERLRKALEAQGVMMLLWYHYASRFRCLLPCVAGSFRYNKKQFLGFDTLGSGLWVSAMLGIGYAARNAMHSGSNIVLYSITGLSSLMMVYTAVKVYLLTHKNTNP